MSSLANESEHRERCNRCSAVNNAEHPLHGFYVELEEVHTERGMLKLCQRCKVRVVMKQRKREEEKNDPNLLTRLLNSIGKPKES